MKIFHGIQNIGGMAGVMAKEQRQYGVESFSYCFGNHFNFYADRYIKATTPLAAALEMTKYFIKEGRHFDIFQFYFGESLTGSYLAEIPLLKKMGKKVFFYFCGCDIRDSKQTIQKYKYSACQQCWPMQCSANQQSARKIAERYADKIFVSTPDLLEFVKDSVLLLQPIVIQNLLSLGAQFKHSENDPPKKSDKITIAHAPSNRMIKGTAHIINAIESLKEECYPVELMLIENLPYQQALQKFLEADLTIDQLLVGAYGQCSVEMMALGKPVICYLREDLIQYYPEKPPIINANPDTLKSVLIDLIERREQWQSIGEQGIAYARTHHDAKNIAKKALSLYGCEVASCVS